MKMQMRCPKCGEGTLIGRLHTVEECRLVAEVGDQLKYENIDLVSSELVHLSCDKCLWELDVTGMIHEDILDVLWYIAMNFERQQTRDGRAKEGQSA